MRRIRRRAMEFAEQRGIIISRVPFGDSSHKHPCECRACVLCTCKECICHIRDVAANKGYQGVDPSICPCACRTYYDKFVCPLCKSYATFCFGQGLLCCSRCATLFPQTDETLCVSVSVEDASQRALDNIIQETDTNSTTIDETDQSSTVSMAVRRPSPIDAIRAVIAEYGSNSSTVESRGERTDDDCSQVTDASDGSSPTAFDIAVRTRVDEARRAYNRRLKVWGLDQPKLLDLTRIKQFKGRNRHVQTLLYDAVAARNNEIREQHRRDDSLLWKLRTEAAFRTRDTDLPDLLKRKGEAWLRVNRPDMSEKDRHLALANAVNNAVLDNKIDRDFRTMLRRQDPIQIQVYNSYVRGAVVPKRGLWNRFLRNIGFRQYADKKWVSTAYQVLPSPK